MKTHAAPVKGQVRSIHSILQLPLSRMVIGILFAVLRVFPCLLVSHSFLVPAAVSR